MDLDAAEFDPTLAASLGRLVEDLALPFQEYFRFGLEVGSVQREDLSLLIESACHELTEFFLREEHVERFEVLDRTALEDYTDWVMDRVRTRLRAAMGLAGYSERKD